MKKLNLHKPSKLQREARQFASAAQARYMKLGVAATQHMRNEVPMRTLLPALLPHLPYSFTTLAESKPRTLRLTAFGKQFTKTETIKVTAQDVFGVDFEKRLGLTKGEVVDLLKKHKFPNTNAATIGQTLTNLRSAGIISATLEPHNGEYRGGRPKSRYFVRVNSAAEVSLP